MDPTVVTFGDFSASVGLWIPLDQVEAMGGFGMWARIDAAKIEDSVGVPNFNREDPWDPGTGEQCSFPTSSLGIPGVRDGTTAPNNNCSRVWYTFGEYTYGPLRKLIDNSTRRMTFQPGRQFTVKLTTPVALRSGNEELFLCDAWDAPDQSAQPRSAWQLLNPDVPPTFQAELNGRKVTLPADLWRVEYREDHEASLRPSPSTGAVDRCAGTEGLDDGCRVPRFAQGQHGPFCSRS